ncbi:hypothetical protein CI266_004931 [Salmonella enterica subsp. enterica serovar Kotte]|nr:hypothetical protein [Salmonella enterica subsp. enterica serovar Kotte]
MMIEIALPDIYEQHRIVYADRVEKACTQLRDNLAAPRKRVHCSVNPADYGTAHMALENEGWQPPAAILVEAWFLQFMDAFPEYGTDKKLAELLGLTGSSNDRRIRSFRKGERPVPYGVWRRFLVITGRVNQEILPVMAFIEDAR